MTEITKTTIYMDWHILLPVIEMCIYRLNSVIIPNSLYVYASKIIKNRTFIIHQTIILQIAGQMNKI